MLKKIIALIVKVCNILVGMNWHKLRDKIKGNSMFQKYQTIET